MVPQAVEQVSRKKCCCNQQTQLTGCDCCPTPIAPFTMPAWEVTIPSGGQVNCATGSGSVGEEQIGFPYCVCGECSVGPLTSANLRALYPDNNPVDCEPVDPSNPCGVGGWACDGCLPEGGSEGAPFPGGTAVLRTYGCRSVPAEDDPTICGAPSVGIDPTNSNNCSCCETEICEGNDNAPFYEYDDIPDGVSYVSALYRCRLRPENCCPGFADSPHPKDQRVWTMIRVSFYAPGYVIKRNMFVCNLTPQGVLEWQCVSMPDVIVPFGQSWSCVYARPQAPCEWYAEGQYRLIYVSTDGCLPASGPLASECGCSDKCPHSGLTEDCNWDGVQTGKLSGIWQPPSSITVTRIQ